MKRGIHRGFYLIILAGVAAVAYQWGREEQARQFLAVNRAMVEARMKGQGTPLTIRYPHTDFVFPVFLDAGMMIGLAAAAALVLGGVGFWSNRRRAQDSR